MLFFWIIKSFLTNDLDTTQLHHPGSKQQLEEVWEKQDHMEQQQFDPKAFFMMHGEWWLTTLLINRQLFVTVTSPRDKGSVIRDLEKCRQNGFKRFQPKGVFHDAW